MAKLAADVACSDDDQAFWGCLQFEETDVVKEAGLLQSRDRRNQRAGACGDHKFGGRDRPFSHFQKIVPDKLRLLLVVGQALLGSKRRFEVGARPVHDLVHAAHNLCKIDLVYAGVNAYGSCLLDGSDDVCRIDEQLGRDAAGVQAGATGGASVHQSDPQPGTRGLGSDVRPCSGADYDEIEFIHDIEILEGL